MFSAIINNKVYVYIIITLKSNCSPCLLWLHPQFVCMFSPKKNRNIFHYIMSIKLHQNSILYILSNFIHAYIFLSDMPYYYRQQFCNVFILTSKRNIQLFLTFLWGLDTRLDNFVKFDYYWEQPKCHIIKAKSYCIM